MTSSTFSQLADLPLQIDSYQLERLESATSSGFTRVSTVIKLVGAGSEGVGEDVTYEATDQDRFQQDGRDLPIAGSYTVASFSRHLETLDLFSVAPEHDAYYLGV